MHRTGRINARHLRNSHIRLLLNQSFPGVSRKQSTPNFPKNKHFLPSDTYTYARVSGGRKCSFLGKFGALCFLETSVLRFALLPYYRRFYCFKLTMHLVLPNIFKKKKSYFLQNNFKIIIYLKLMRSKGVLQVWCLLQCIY